MESALTASSLFSCDGMVAVVTGGGTGIGLMIACALEQNGAQVCILGRRLDILETAARRNNVHGRIYPFQADVADKTSLQTAVERIQEAFGAINLLVNNAGIAARPHIALKMPSPFPNTRRALGIDTSDEAADVTALRTSLWQEPMKEWDDSFRINLTAVWFTSVAFLELLDLGNKNRNLIQTSQIVTIGSIGGFHRLMSSGFAYHTSKAGVTHLGKMMASNFVQYGIRSNVIIPGLYPSEMSAGGTGKLDENNRSTLPVSVPESVVPLKTIGDERDMAAAILSLAGPGGKYYNGSVLLTDGGRLGVLPSTY